MIPEEPFDIEEVCETIKKRHARGKDFSIVVTAEGAKIKGEDLVLKNERRDAFGHVLLGGIGQWLGSELEKRTGFETRVAVL